MAKIMTVISIVCMLLECYEAATQINCTEGIVHTQNYTSYTVLDTDGIFHLYWEPPRNRSTDSEITFKVEVRTKGYFGLGFSPNGGMPGSDIITGWIRDGKAYFQDRHATAYSLPPNDNQQDYELIAACENDTSTVFEFRRKLDTCDVNDMVIEESTMRIIYAYSDDDPGFDDPFYHQENRGSKSILLLQNNEQLLNPDSMLYWDILAPDVDITSFETLYLCKIYKSPEVSEKQHIVYGGFSSKEEMCGALIMYYPLMNQFISLSVPTYASINKALNTNIIQEADIYSQLANYDWKSVDMNEVQNIMRYSEHQTQCQPGPFPEELPFASYPNDLIPYEEESKCNTLVR